ncbi:PLP-dependent aminotransferase family protein [Streptomyces marincola]|uniref:GntR family transcriptional regulator n=1 Tax=Streptomyces marincola TaxID=2878388 RepID=A0A1W7CUB5_9ACTN|nr:PLP-dependent aminotransferase family protein [Streptomyces marincola]ARQ68337.1 GntR family transcriptional regulator [Streptomyces marincola]
MRQARYKAIVDELRASIRAGRLPPGTRLPTHRELAARHGIALATATRVYAELTAAGLVAGEPGRGTFVRDRSGYDGFEPLRVPRGGRVADLSFNQPPAPGRSAGLRAALRGLAARGDIEALLAQHPPGGRAEDRAAVATYLLDRGIDVPPDGVLLTAGAQHGLDTALRARATPGDVVAVDELTYPGIRLSAETQGIELAPVPCGPGGTDPAALDALCRRRRVGAFYTMPTLHNPLGRVMGARDRERLVAVAREHDIALIEDGTYAFLVPDAPPALFSLAPERTTYVASLSKNLATGLRFGFLVTPAAHRARAIRVLRASTWGTPAVITALATAWLRDGTVARTERQRREEAGTRQRLARRVLGGLDYRAHPGAPFGWLVLPAGLRADRVAHTLADRGVLVSTAEAFAAGPHPPAALRLALASPPTQASLEEALLLVREEVTRPGGMP